MGISIEDFKAIFRRTKSREPAPPPPKVDGEALGLGNQLVTLYRRAVADGLTLGGRLDTLKSNVEDAITDGQFEVARQGIEGIAGMVEDQRAYQAALGPLQGELTRVARITTTLPDRLGRVVRDAAALEGELGRLTAAGNYSAALGRLNGFAVRLGGFAEAERTWQADQQQFDIAYGTYGKRADELSKMSEDVNPDFERKRTTMETVHQRVKDKRKALEYGEALTAVYELRDAVAACDTAYKLYLGEDEAYYRRLDALRPRIGQVDAALKNKAYGNPPGEPLKTLVDKYSSARTELVRLQKRKDWSDANAALDTVQRAIAAIERSRLDALKNELAAVDTPAKVKSVVDKMQPNEIAALSVDDKIKLMKTLRTGGALTSAQKEAQYTLYNNMPMDEAFVRIDNQARRKLIDTLSKDPKFTEARTKWNDPSWPDSKREAFLKYAATKQCEVMGHGNPAPTIAFTRTRKCRFGDDPRDTPVCPKHREEVPVGSNDRPKRCPACNAGSKYFYGTLGACDTNYPANISLNAVAECGFKDLRVILDTVVHENTHAYQMMLMDKFNKGLLDSSDPAYDQARLFNENNLAYVENNMANKNQSGAYQAQPLEIHSMTMGPKVCRGLLGLDTVAPDDLR